MHFFTSTSGCWVREHDKPKVVVDVQFKSCNCLAKPKLKSVSGLIPANGLCDQM